MKRGLVALLLVLVLAPCAGAASPVPLDIEVKARQIAPGEPLRILVRSPQPLDELGGRFREHDVTLLPDDPGGLSWSGWAMIGLLEGPGSSVLELRGRARDGREAHGARALVVVDKAFREERLEVEPRYVEPPADVLARIRGEKERLAVIYALRTPHRAHAPFVRPVPGEKTAPFGTRRIFNGKPRAPHSGLDLRAKVGTPVLAAGPGTVVLAEDLYYSGQLVILDHGGGLFTLYAHLSAIEVEVGQDVTAGVRLGLSGATGRVTGPHLHWGAKLANRPFDPRALLDPALFSN